MHHSQSVVRADIQGLRGISVLLVVLYHAGLTVISGGYVGVDIFFVISGYLITGLLLREQGMKGDISLFAFYGRRVRRLLPAATLVILTTLLAGMHLYPPLQVQDLVRFAIASTLYLSNILLAFMSTDYLADDISINPYLHTWSLSVEEQFYLFWPIFLILAMKVLPGRTAAAKALPALAAVAVISFVANLYLTQMNQPWAFFSPATRAWEFALGGLLCLWRPGSLAAESAVARFGGYAGTLLVIASALLLTHDQAFPGAIATLPVAGAILILLPGQLGTTSALPERMIAHPVLSFFGDISYSLYLWHWPVFVLLPMAVPEAGVAGTLAGLTLSVLLAWATYHFVENPIRHKNLPGARWALTASLAIGLPFSALWIASYVSDTTGEYLQQPFQQALIKARADKPRVYLDGCHTDILEVEVIDCAYGPEKYNLTVVLFGDSHAAHWLPALEIIAEQEGWRLIPITKSGCPAADYLVYRRQLHRYYIECEIWRQSALDRIDEIRPELVIMASARSYLERETNNETDRWRKATQRTLARLRQTSQLVVLMRDTPRPDGDVVDCLSIADWRQQDAGISCRIQSHDDFGAAIYHAELKAAAAYQNVATVDMTGEICPGDSCSALYGNIIRYRDASHLTTAFSSHLYPKLSRQLEAVAEVGHQRATR